MGAMVAAIVVKVQEVQVGERGGSPFGGNGPIRLRLGGRDGVDNRWMDR